MKNKYFGDILSSDKFNDDGSINNARNSALHQEFLRSDDKLSHRSLNRPIREEYEDREASYINLQTANKELFGQKENTIFPDVFEEFSPDGVKVGKFFNRGNFLRIPTGAAFIKAFNEDYKSYKYTFTEGTQYKRDIFIDNDHYALSLINRPNLELMERQLGEHFCFDLNNQNTNIILDYELYDDENGKQRILYKYEITFNEYVYTEKVSNSSDDSSSQVTFMDIAPSFRKITSDGEELHTVFDVVKSIDGKLGSHVTEENDFFSLEEIIPLSGITQGTEYCIVANLDTDNSILVTVDEIPDFEEYNGQRIYYVGDTIIGTQFTKGSTYRSNGFRWIKEDIAYSYSKIYALVPKEDLDFYKHFVPIYNVGFAEVEGQLTATAEPLLEMMDRTTLHIKNIENTNCINRLVVERERSNVNLSEGHMPKDEGEDNLTIGLCTLGYGIITSGESGLRYQMFHDTLEYSSDVVEYIHTLDDQKLTLSGGHDLTHDLDILKLSLYDPNPHNSKYRIRKNLLKVISDRDCEHDVDGMKLTLTGGYDLAHAVIGRTLYLYIDNTIERDPTNYDENVKTEIGVRNIAIGNGALKFTRDTGQDRPEDNIGIGIDALSDIGYGKENIELGGRDNVYMPNKLLNIGYNLHNPLAYRIQMGTKNMFVGYGNGKKAYTIKDGSIVIGFDNETYDNSTIFGRDNVVTGKNNFVIGNGITCSEDNQTLIGGSVPTSYLGDDGVKATSPYLFKSAQGGDYDLEVFADSVKFRSSQVVVNGKVRTNAVNITSLRSSKTDITPTKHKAVEEINKIEIVDFFYKDDKYKENPKVGFIADDTNEIFSTPEKNSVDVYNCIGMLLKAVQELSAENKELRKKINIGE